MGSIVRVMVLLQELVLKMFTHYLSVKTIGCTVTLIVGRETFNMQNVDVLFDNFGFKLGQHP